MRLVVPVLAGWLLAGCADTDPVESLEQAATACRSPKPSPRVCYEVDCDPVTRTWDISPLPSGEPCHTNGHCDGNGTCIGPPLPPPPTAPTNVRIAERDRTFLALEWTASVGADSYQVSSPSGLALNTIGATANFGSLTPGTQYCFTITAVNAGGSAASPQVCGTTEPAPFDMLLGFSILYPLDSVPPYMMLTREVQPNDGGLLDSLELPAASNDARLTGLYLYAPSEILVNCPPVNHVFLPVGGSVSGPTLAQVFGSEHPPLRDENGASLSIQACATFTTGQEENVTIHVTENYSTP